jgi:isoleucyl-tRNA synthetase
MPFEIISRRRGSELAGLKYEPLYNFLPTEGGYEIVTAEYVSATDGTGIVHIAPAFGEDDMQTGKKHNLPVVETLDTDGNFVPEVTPWAGMFYKEVNEPVMEDLEKRGLLYRKKTIKHSIPICWRCNTPLIYRAQPAWFVNVTKLKPKLLETAKKISWYPGHFKDGRFGKGLETAPDWNISRTRYWGAPLPVWECDLCEEREIISSIADLKKRATPGSFPAELDVHRPGIDAITLACGCGGVMRRVPDVFDCWFESGAMPYAAEHYPFGEDSDFEGRFPADFIGEAQDQTRGWFYVLHVLATALFNKPAFKNVIVTGLIMAEDGKKMSKSLKNYPDPWEVLTQYGADALRLYILQSPLIEGDQLNFSTRELDEVSRKVLAILWNVTTFYQTYAGNDNVELAKPRSAHVLDRWLYARLHTLIREVTDAYEGYELTRAVRPLRAFVDDLSTWWLRRSRDRIKAADAYDRLDALKTLREVLLDFSALLAPAAPFIADRVYLDLGGSKASVHLDRWPKSDARLIDEKLLQDMAWLRAAATAGQEQRALTKMPVRQALASATVFLKDPKDVSRLAAKSDLLDLLRDELNVEEVRLAADPAVENIRVELDTVLTPELKEKGMARELVRRFMALRKERRLTPGDRIRAAIATSDKEMRATLERLAERVGPDVKADGLEVGSDLPDGMEPVAFTLDGQDLTIGIEKQ